VRSVDVEIRQPVWLLVRSNLGRPQDGQADTGAVRKYVTDLRAGIRWLRRDRLMITISVLVALVNALFTGLSAVLIPAYGTRVWHSSTQVGILIAAIGGGALLGTVLYGWIGHRFGRRSVYTGSFLLFGGPIYLTLAIDPDPFLLVPLILLFAIGFGPLNPVVGAVSYERIPAELRGRVFGVLASVSYSVMPFGPMVAGLLLDGIGLTATLFTLGSVTVVLTLCPLVFPIWREMDATPPDSAAQAEVHEATAETT